MQTCGVVGELAQRRGWDSGRGLEPPAMPHSSQHLTGVSPRLCLAGLAGLREERQLRAGADGSDLPCPSAHQVPVRPRQQASAGLLLRARQRGAGERVLRTPGWGEGRCHQELPAEFPAPGCLSWLQVLLGESDKHLQRAHQANLGHIRREEEEENPKSAKILFLHFLHEAVPLQQ